MIDWFKQLNPYKVAGFGATGAGVSGGALWLMSSTGKDAKEDVENKRKDLLRAAIILKQIPPDQWFGQNADFYKAIKAIGEIHSLTQPPYEYHSAIHDALYTPTGRLSNIINPSVLFEIAKVNTSGPIGYDTLGNPQYDPTIVEGFKTEFNKSTGGNLEKAFPMNLQAMQSELSGVPAAIPGAPGAPGAAAPSTTKPTTSPVDEYKKRRDEVLGELKSVGYSDGAVKAFSEKFRGVLAELESAQSLINQRQQILDDVEKQKKAAIDAEIKAQESKIKDGTTTRELVATQAAIAYDNQHGNEAIRLRDALISARSKFADVEKQFSDQLAGAWNAASKETVYDYIERTDDGVIYVLKQNKLTGQITPVIQGGKTDAEAAKAQEVAAKAQSDPTSNKPAGTSTAATAGGAGRAGGAGGAGGPTADGGFRFAPSGGSAKEYTPVIHERLELGEDGKVYKIIFDAKRPIGPGNELGRYLAGAEESNQFLGTGLWQLDKNADGSIVAISKDGKMQTIREATPEGLAAVARSQEKSDLELKQARLNDALAGPELFAKIGKAQYDAESNARKLALEEADLQIKGQAQKISDLVAAGKMNVPQALRYLGKFQEAAIEVERARQNFEAERTRRMEEKARAQAFADQYETEDQITSVLNAAGGKIGQAQNVARQAALAQYAGATPGQKLANMRGFDVSYQDPGLYKNTEEYKSMMAPINQEEYGLTPFQKIIEDAVAKTPINAYNPASYFKGLEGLLSPLPTSRVSSTGGLEAALSPLPTSPAPATEAVPSAFPMNTNITNYSNALIKSPSQTANLFDNLFQDYPGSQLYNTSSAPLSQYPAILESMDTQNTYG